MKNNAIVKSNTGCKDFVFLEEINILKVLIRKYSKIRYTKEKQKKKESQKQKVNTKIKKKKSQQIHNRKKHQD